MTGSGSEPWNHDCSELSYLTEVELEVQAMGELNWLLLVQLTVRGIKANVKP